MTRSAGTKLGPCEIVSVLGAGGMGEVYRAPDTNLGCNVALKVSRETVMRDWKMSKAWLYRELSGEKQDGA